MFAFLFIVYCWHPIQLIFTLVSYLNTYRMFSITCLFFSFQTINILSILKLMFRKLITLVRL